MRPATVALEPTNEQDMPVNIEKLASFELFASPSKPGLCADFDFVEG